MKITVLGAGNLGLAQAGHLASLGHSVCLYNRTPQRLAPLRDGPLRMWGAIEGSVRIGQVTADLAEAVGSAELIFVDIPATGHPTLAAELRRALPATSSATLLLHPGQTFGSREVALTLELPRFPKLVFGELQTALYTSRISAPGEIHVLAVKRSVALAAYPAAHRERLARVRALYPQLFIETDTLVTALSNVQAFIHPGICLLNLPRIERGESFRIYREGLSEPLGRLFDACDAERLSLARSLEVVVPTAAEWFGRCYGIEAHTALEAMRRIDAYDGLLGPTSLETRLLREDVPAGLVPLVELCGKLGVAAPSLQGLLTSCTAAMGGLGEGARTLERLGLHGMDATTLKSAF